MSGCDTCDRIGAFHDGELDETSAAAVRSHLASCAACRAELTRLQDLSKVFGAAPMPRLSQIALARIHQDERLWPDGGAWRFASGLAAMAASVLLVGAAMLYRQSQPTFAPPQPWEAAAVVSLASDEPAGADDRAVAEWIVSDLSRQDRERPHAR